MVKLGDHSKSISTFECNFGELEAQLEGLLYEDPSSLDSINHISAPSCSFCGIRNNDCLIKCVTTGKWFCNGRINSASSCIINHLIYSKNRLVQLNKHSTLGDQVLECYATGSRNVLNLGFVPLKTDNTVLLLSREITVGGQKQPVINELDVDLSLWQPLIENRQFVHWLVNVPSKKERIQARKLSSNQIKQLEELWLSNPATPIHNLDEPETGTLVHNVSLRYEDGYHYQNVFAPLVKLEADFDRALKESQKKENISIRWETISPNKHIAYFLFPYDDNDTKLVPGDEIRLRLKGLSHWSGTGYVIGFTEREEIKLEMKRSQTFPLNQKTGFTLEFAWKRITFDRMQDALKIFAVEEASMSGPVYNQILGHNLKLTSLDLKGSEKILGAPGLPEPSRSQRIAIREILNQHVSLIQGPPGTGKTVTLANIVYYMSKLGFGQVLVSAPSNVAVDQLAKKISQTGLKVVRLAAKATETLESSVKHLRLQYQVSNLNLQSKIGVEFAKYRNLKEIQGDLKEKDEKRYKSLKRDIERELLQDAEVICCTCSNAGDSRISRFMFRQLLLDEATQACEPEALIPIVNGIRQLILVGDHLQLGPVVMNRKAAISGLNQSLFERLIFTGVKPYKLTKQYRMHPCLSEFPSNTFYEGILQNEVNLLERTTFSEDFPWPQPEKPMIFHVNLGHEEISSSGTSYLNRTEASNVEKIVTLMLRNELLPSQIGVITPYVGQRAYIQFVMERIGPLCYKTYQEVEVASVDAFQGREKDYIILSCVRSNSFQGIGFLSDPRRLNVALTRAKYGLIILGNPMVLSQHPLWNSLLMHNRYNGCLVEGPITNLKISSLTLIRTRKQSF